MTEIKHISKSIWQPILIVVLAFLLFQNACNRPKVSLADTKQPEAQSMFYFNEYLKENAKRIDAEKLAQTLKIEQEKQLKSWQNRRQISKVIQPIADIINCNDTIQHIAKIAHINDSLCIGLVSSYAKVLKQKDSVLLFSKKEIFNLETSLDFKQKQTDAINQNFQSVNNLLKIENQKKWFWKTVTVGLSGFLIYDKIIK